MATDGGDARRIAATLARLYGERAEQEALEFWRFHKRNGATNAARVWQRVLATLAAMRTGARRTLH